MASKRTYGFDACKTCYNEYIYRPKLKARGYYRRLVNFKGKEILLKTNPRKGFCQRCEKTGYTHLHHEAYDDIDILKHTIELCPSCHARESWRLGQMVVTKSKRKQGMEK